MDRKIILENGKVFKGKGFGSNKEVINEIVFNTSVVGYQEILSDPSYNLQMVCMTYPLIGNYGLTDDDYETKRPYIGGFIVREYNNNPSNFRFTKTLNEVMEEFDIPGIAQVDTREITRIIRNEGSMKVMICDIDKDEKEALEELKNYNIPKNQIENVSCKKVWYSRTQNFKYNVIAIDCGIKYNIIKELNKLGCNVTILPHNSTEEEILRHEPDGIFLSNGPGDPNDAKNVIDIVKKLQKKLPIFGICLGHQIIALANDAKI